MYEAAEQQKLSCVYLSWSDLRNGREEEEKVACTEQMHLLSIKASKREILIFWATNR